MDSSRVHLFLLPGLVVVFLFGTVKSDATSIIKNLKDDELYQQIQVSKHAMYGTDGLSRLNHHYRLVLIVNEAVSRGLLRKVENTHQSGKSDTSTDLYIRSDDNQELWLPSISDVSEAEEYYKKNPFSVSETEAPSNSPSAYHSAQGTPDRPEPSRSNSVRSVESINTASENFLQNEYQRLKDEKERDELNERSAAFIERNKKVIMLSTPQYDYEPKSPKLTGCLGCFSSKRG